MYEMRFHREMCSSDHMLARVMVATLRKFEGHSQVAVSEAQEARVILSGN
jgi:hypothetical protein